MPATTPPNSLSRIRNAVKEAATSAEFKAAMEKGADAWGPTSTRPSSRKYWERDAARLKVAREKIGKVEEK